jgi:hypothetical protein
MTMPNISNPTGLFPDLPREAPIVDKDGKLTDLWSLGFAQLFQSLQTNYKNEGILIPSLTTTQANAIAATYTRFYSPMNIPLDPGVPDISGQMIYNRTILAPQIFIITFDGATPPNVTGASWKTFTIT